MVNFERQSAPPTTTRSSFPDFMSLAPSIIEFADEEHAVLIPETKSCMPKVFATFVVQSPEECISIYFRFFSHIRHVYR